MPYTRRAVPSLMMGHYLVKTTVLHIGFEPMIS